MSALIRPKRWGQQKPPAGAQLDRGHPLAQGLFGYFPVSEGGGAGLVDLAGNAVARCSAPSMWRATPLGPSVAGTQNGTDTVQITGPAFRVDRADFTIGARIWVSGLSNGFNNRLIAVLGDYAVDWGALLNLDYLGGVDYRVQLQVVTGGAGQSATLANATVNDAPLDVVGVRNGTALTVYVNGVSVATGVSNSGNIRSRTGGSSLVSGYTAAGINTLPGGVVWAGFWGRALQAAEARWLTSEPYAMILPQSPVRRWFVVASGGGNVTVTPGTIALSLAAPAVTPVIQAIPGVVALAMSEPAPVPVLQALPGAVSLTASLPAPTPTLQAQPGALALALSEPAPTPVIQALPGAIATSLSVLSPTPVLQATPGAIALALSTLAATPGIQANPSAVALALSILAPSISAGSGVTVSPSTIALALSALAPTPSIQATPGAIALALSILAAAPALQAKPGAIALLLAALAPTVSAASTVTVTPGVVALAMAVLAATPGIQAKPSTIALVLQVLAVQQAVSGVVLVARARSFSLIARPRA